MSTTEINPSNVSLTSEQPHNLQALAQFNSTNYGGNDSTRKEDDQVSRLPSSVSQPPFQYNASLHAYDTAPSQAYPTIASPSAQTPLSAGLRLRTNSLREERPEDLERTDIRVPRSEVYVQHAPSTTGLPVRSSSVRSALSSLHYVAGSLSPASTFSSPGIGPLLDLTPLPSPITSLGSPGHWKRTSISGDLDESTSEMSATSPPMGPYLEPLAFVRTSPKKRRVPTGLASAVNGVRDVNPQICDINAANHARNRSLSEYVPDSMQNQRGRNIVFSGSSLPQNLQPLSPPDQGMHREEYLAIQRGLAIPIPKPLTPPSSNRGRDSSDLERPHSSLGAPAGPLSLCYEARTVQRGDLKTWRTIRQLGKGTFSTVMLATSEKVGTSEVSENQSDDSCETSIDERQVNPKSLVAIKICEQGPAGGADEKKVESSLKRELDILKTINHPSLVLLKAFSVVDRQALLVLNYCAGGDLFELASLKLDVLVPSLIRRIFAELVEAVQYLHAQYIVHRDIKLENVLVNIRTEELSIVDDWQTYPSPIVTLTDLGLGRWIPKPPESPLLETRCGSEDYAAPEVLMGQQYDGRATDAWALGVLLYAIMEGRLPFDPVPGSRRKSPTSHRIARCEWNWVRWADKEGEWDPVKGNALEGGRKIVEGLLVRARSRWALEKVRETEWVGGGIVVEGGLRRAEDDDEEE